MPATVICTMMTRLLPGLMVLVVGLVPSQGAPLDTGARESYLDKVEAILKAAQDKQRGKFGVARTAFRTAAQSNEAAVELYLNCVERVQFDGEQKKATEFRDWKRAEKDRLADPSFAVALRHQLRWLALTLDAAEAGAERSALTAEARRAVDAVFADAVHLKGHQQLLRSSVLDSVFARAYTVKDLELKDWPLAPANLSEVYTRLVLPPLRKPDRVADLRTAWLKWIEQSGVAAEHWAGGKKVDVQGEERTQGFERFRTEEYPQMVWEMEEDLFRNGDQQAAAMRMYSILENTQHRRAMEWAKRFQTLLRGGAPESNSGN